MARIITRGARRPAWPARPGLASFLRAAPLPLFPPSTDRPVLLFACGGDQSHAPEPGGEAVWRAGGQGTALVSDHRGLRPEPAVHPRDDYPDGGAAGGPLRVQPSRGG